MPQHKHLSNPSSFQDRFQTQTDFHFQYEPIEQRLNRISWIGD